MSLSLGKTADSFANAAECAAVAKSELNCPFFSFDETNTTDGSGTCRCCSAIDGRAAANKVSIYSLKPNLPAYLKNVVDPKYCTFKCPGWTYPRTSDNTCQRDTCGTKQRFGPDGRCHACKPNMKQDTSDEKTCVPDCPQYRFYQGTDSTCQKDSCTVNKKLGVDGHCAPCPAGEITHPTDEKQCQAQNASSSSSSTSTTT